MIAREAERPHVLQVVTAGQLTTQAEPEKTAGEMQEVQVVLEEQARQYCKQGKHTLFGTEAEAVQ